MDATTPSPARFALGIGLTNACNLACTHCYRGTGADRLSEADVLAAVDALPTRAVNLGTGESAMHPDLLRILEALFARGITVTLTTNGYTAERLPDALLSRLADVEFSIDHPSREAHDAARGPGNWDLIERQMARTRSLGVATTIVTVLMSTNSRSLPELSRLAGSRGAVLRVNVYQSVQTDRFRLSYDEFWHAWRDLFAVADLIACGEPILRAVLGLEKQEGAGCGATTVRITPRRRVVPCVYARDEALTLSDLQRVGTDVVRQPSFTRLAQVPTVCARCPQVETCGGGCASRRLLRAGLDVAEEYCPLRRGSEMTIDARLASEARARPKAASACTVIVRAREPEVTRA